MGRVQLTDTAISLTATAMTFDGNAEKKKGHNEAIFSNTVLIYTYIHYKVSTCIHAHMKAKSAN